MDSIANCPLCFLTIEHSELERHVNRHFDNEEEDDQFTRDLELAKQLALEKTSPSGASSPDIKVSCLISLQARSSFHEVKVESGGGLMALLRRCLELDAKSVGNSTSTVFLSGYVDHYQIMPSEDAGWGCGWRNIQMLSSHLLSSRQDASKLLFGRSGFIPDIPYLQRWLEIAWENGFDPFGARHFNHSVYGSKNWIGTTECAALLRSFGLRARIVDFGPKELESLFLSVPGTCTSSQRGTPTARVKRKAFQVHGPIDRYFTSRYRDVSQPDSPTCRTTGCSTSHLSGESSQTMASNKLRSSEGPQVLLDWVWNYFSDGIRTISSCHSCVTVTDKAPLYFQHDGHSRTIVGIEVNHHRNGKLVYNLLVLDPGHRTAALERSLEENVGWKRLIKRGVNTLRKPQYQICYIDLGIATKEEMEGLKTMDSTFIDL